MANLSANTTYRTTRRGTRSYIVANTVQIYAGALVCTNAGGFLTNCADTAGNRFVGVALHDALGDTSATPNIEVQVDTSGLCIINTSVAGAAAQSDVNSLVYVGTSNPADLTLTATTNLKAVGYVTRWYSGTLCDVQLFAEEENYGL